MKNYKILIFSLLAFILFIRCGKNSSASLEDLKWLQGSWQSQDSLLIESWALQDGQMVGNVFSNRTGKILETLRIFKTRKLVLYEATVFSQNQGKPVQFAMDSEGLDSLHFVNMNHDYPNYIIYKRLTDTTVYMGTSGTNGTAFHSVMKRLKE